MAYTLVPTELIQDGAVTSAKLDTNIAISGTLSVGGVTTLATHLVMGDNDKIKIGTGGDLEIYHDASNSYIANSTGNLYIGDTNGSVHIQAKLNEDSIVATADGAVTLYYDNAPKLATSSAGVTVTGALAATLSTAAQPNITSVGTLSALTVDDITINGSTISDAGDLTLDVAGNINLDADGGTISLKDGGTEFAFLAHGGSDKLSIKATIQDADIGFFGNDGGGEITALTLDMSNAGAATFNAGATFGAGIDVTGTITGDDGLSIQGGTGNAYLQVGSDTGSWTWKNYRSSHKLALEDSDGTGEVLNFDTSGNATFSGIVTSADFFKATGANLKFSAGGTHVLNIDLNRKIYPNTHNSTDLGHSSTLAFRNLYLAGGVVFDAVAGNATSNTLDDYEEGTWTPTLLTGSGTFTGATYTKVGRIVTCNFIVGGITNRTSSAAFVIESLPFAAYSGDRAATLGCLSRNISSGFASFDSAYFDTATRMSFYTTSTAGYRQLLHSDLSSTNSTMYVAVTYMAA